MDVSGSSPDAASPQDDDRVTAHSYGAIDTSRVSNECWLIRVPKELAELLDHAPEGTDLGEMVFTKGGGASGPGRPAVKPSLTVQLSETLEQLNKEYVAKVAAEKAAKKIKPSSSLGAAPVTSAVLPMHYSLQAMTKRIPTLHPFVRNPNNGQVNLLGTVSRTANLQVEKDTTYRAKLKDRLVATNITSSRYVKPVEATESVITKQQRSRVQQQNLAAEAAGSSTNRKKTFGDAVLKFGKRMMEAAHESSVSQAHLQSFGGGPATKKARQFAPDQPLRSVIFELFGQQQHWTVKDLKAAAVAGGATTTINSNSKRAETEIRDVLKEIGVYHRSGDHKNMWELRKEFQQQGSTPTTA